MGHAAEDWTMGVGKGALRSAHGHVAPPAAPDSTQARRLRGAGAWATGASAEEGVALAYERRGATIAARRWRSPAGEIDLVVRDGPTVAAVEVKKARSLDEAAHRLHRRQIARLCAAAALFCEGEPRGSLTDLRFDLALVDGMGRVRLIENAWGQTGEADDDPSAPARHSRSPGSRANDRAGLGPDPRRRPHGLPRPAAPSSAEPGEGPA